MRVRITIQSIKRRALKLIPEDGIYINEGDVFCGFIDRLPEYLNLRFTEEEHHDPTNFIALGKVQTDDGSVVTTKLGKFVVEELNYETMGNLH